MNAEILSVLCAATLAISAATIIALSLRGQVRHRLGAVAAYALWALVPAMLLAVLLPSWLPLRDVTLPAPMRATVQVLAAGVQSQAPVAGTQSMLAGFWLLGVLATAALLLRQQRRFVRSLGRLQPIDAGVYRAGNAHGTPALIGALAPRIVLPAHFELHYTPLQRELILLHERTHLRRGDAQINALVAALRSLFWFNPLVHYAAACMRIDQELACDALVLRQRPDARRPYAEAMLNTQLADTGLPVGCQWQSSHPLKERIEMMNRNPQSAARRRLGTLLLAALIGAGASLAFATQSSLPTTAPATTTDRDAAFARMSPPKYPESAAKAGITGSVMLQIGIDAQGRPATINIVNSQPPGVFDAAASAAAETWTFEPAIEHGVAVASQVLVPVQFDTDEAAAARSAPVLDALKVASPQR